MRHQLPRSVDGRARRHRTRAAIAVTVLALPAAALADDRTNAPNAPRDIRADGADRWKSGGDFTVTWSNPEHNHAIEAAYYRVCPVDSQRGCADGRQNGRGIRKLSIKLPEAGDYTLTVWLRDERGRSDLTERSDAVRLRFDDEPPTSSGIELGAGGDPGRVSMQVADRLSGPGETEIELRGPGGQARSLPVQRSAGGDGVSARIPDLELTDGTYEVRALMRDLAGNLAVVKRDVELPLRERTALAASAQVTRTVRRCQSVAVRLRGRLTRRLSCRNVAVSQPVAFTERQPVRIPHGQRLLITGVLDGAPSGAPILVTERPRTTGMPPRTTQVRAGSGGRFAAPLEPGPSRMVELSYAGGEDSLPSVIRGSFLVPAAGTLVSSRRVVANGQAVRFTGRLLGGPLPDIGRTVDLQAFYRGAWRTFATPRTDPAGAWSHLYRFGATRGDVVYRFRALIKREAGYPYETGVSGVVRVAVRGR